MLHFSKTAVVVLLSISVLFAEYFGLFQIAEVPTTPRSSAMGGSGTALAGGGFGIYNPALPAFASAPFLSCEFGREPGDLSKARIESSWMFPRWFVGASLQVRSTDFYITNEQTDETTMNVAPSSNQAMQATITGGYVIGRLAAGSSINFFEERIGDKSWHAFTYCPGILFELVPNSITIGASLSHYLRFDTTGSPWYTTPVAWYRSARGFPRYARAGIAWRDTVRRWTMPFTAACDFVYSDVYERLMTPLGTEVWVLPSLAARAGVCINHPADIVHFGVGIHFQNIRFDFDYGVSHAVTDIEAKWMFGLTYSLKNPKKGDTLTQKGRKDQPVTTVPLMPPAADSSDVPVVTPDSATVIPAPAGSEVQRDSAHFPEPPSSPSTVQPPAGVRDTVIK